MFVGHDWWQIRSWVVFFWCIGLWFIELSSVNLKAFPWSQPQIATCVSLQGYRWSSFVDKCVWNPGLHSMGNGDSSVVRVLDSWAKGHRYESSLCCQTYICAHTCTYMYTLWCREEQIYFQRHLQNFMDCGMLRSTLVLLKLLHCSKENFSHRKS